MSRSLVTAAVATLCFAGFSQLHSQAPGVRPTALEALRTMKAQNQKILDQQTATLQSLDALKKESSQLRIFARRS